MRISNLLLCTPALILCLCVRATSNHRNIDANTNINIDSNLHHAPSPPPSSSNSPTATPTIIAENVFVPLQKWKQQKIQDIESRVKKDKQLHDNINTINNRHHINKNDANLHPQRRRNHNMRLHYPNNFSSTRRQFLFNHIFSSTCAFHPTTAVSASNTYSNPPSYTPVPAPYNPPQTNLNININNNNNMPNPATDDASAYISEKTDTSPQSITNSGNVNTEDESPAPLFKSIGNQVRKLRDSVSSTITAAAEVSAAAMATASAIAIADFSPANNNINNNPSSQKITTNNSSSGSAAASPSAIATPTVLPSYNHLTPQAPLIESSPHAQPAPPSVVVHDDNSAQQQKQQGNEVPPPIPASTTYGKTESKTPPNSRVQSNNTPGPTSITFTAATNTVADEVTQAASAPVVLNRKSFNFASQGAGAQILAASANAVGAKNIIVENDDKYMLAPCDTDNTSSNGEGYRWVDIELSEYVIMESVQTGNFEHYSSAARKFAVLGSEHYPPKQWNTLGVFDFEDTRGIQTFNITYKNVRERKVSRFLRVVYAGKRGYEYYCPISIFRAFGKNLIADLKDGLETPLQERNTAPPPVQKKAKASLGNINEINRILLEDNLTSLENNNKENGRGNGNKAKFEVDVSKFEAGDNIANGNSQHANGSTKTQDENVNGKKYAEKTTADNEGRQENSGDEKADKPDENRNNENNGREELKAQAAPKLDISSDDQIVLDVVREETLSPVSGNDNIFRRVARMIRLLELNQSLTNQYIDTQLARFAQALAGTQAEQVRISDTHGRDMASIERLNAYHDMNMRELRELRNSSRRRDIVTVVLVAFIGLLLGSHWIMWTAIVAMRNVGNEEEIHINHINHIHHPGGDGVSSAIISPISSPDGAGHLENTVNGNGNSNSNMNVGDTRQGNISNNNNITGSANSRSSTISTISTTASVDGVHVQMTDVRQTRRRRRRRWTEPGMNGSNSNSNSHSGIGSGRPPVGNSPSRRLSNGVTSPSRRSSRQPARPTSPFVSNSFHPLTAAALLEYEQHDVPPDNDNDNDNR